MASEERTGNIAHIKARSKHSLHIYNRWHYPKYCKSGNFAVKIFLYDMRMRYARSRNAIQITFLPVPIFVAKSEYEIRLSKNFTSEMFYQQISMVVTSKVLPWM